MRTKQAKYLKRGDWVLGREPKPGQPRLLARVEADADVYHTVEGPQCVVWVREFNDRIRSQQHPDNIVQVYEDKDMPHRKVTKDEWPAIAPAVMPSPMLN